MSTTLLLAVYAFVSQAPLHRLTAAPARHAPAALASPDEAGFSSRSRGQASTHRKHALKKQSQQLEEQERSEQAAITARAMELVRRRGMIEEYESAQDGSAVSRELRTMKKAGIVPDSACLSAAARVFGRAKKWKHAADAGAALFILGLPPSDAAAGSTMLLAFTRRGELGKAVATWRLCEEHGLTLQAAALVALWKLLTTRESWGELLRLHAREGAALTLDAEMLSGLAHAHGHSGEW